MHLIPPVCPDCWDRLFQPSAFSRLINSVEENPFQWIASPRQLHESKLNDCNACRIVLRVYDSFAQRYHHEADEDDDCLSISIMTKPLEGDPRHNIHNLKIRIGHRDNKNHTIQSGFEVWGDQVSGKHTLIVLVFNLILC